MPIDYNNLSLLDRGAKSLVREVASWPDLVEMRQYCLERWWHMEVSDRLLDATGRYDDARDHRVVYVAKHHDIALIGRAVDFSATPSKVSLLGKLLWYPTCCINFFIRFGQLDNFDILSILRGRSNWFYGCLNILDHPLIYHIPCAFDCPESRSRSLMLEGVSTRHRKTYVVFRTMFWIAIETGNVYHFGSYFRTPSVTDQYFLSIRQRLTSGRANLVVSGDSVSIREWDDYYEELRDVIVFDFV